MASSPSYKNYKAPDTNNKLYSYRDLYTDVWT